MDIVLYQLDFTYIALLKAPASQNQQIIGLNQDLYHNRSGIASCPIIHPNPHRIRLAIEIHLNGVLGKLPVHPTAPSRPCRQGAKS